MPRIQALGVFLLGMALAMGLRAQTTTGSLYARVMDEAGGVLPGAAVTLSGCGAPQTTTTGSQGELHFLNLAPCFYSVRTELPGFATVERINVAVNLGANTELTIAMSIAPVAATVTVSSESPLLDTHKQASGTVFTNVELRSIPTARDPWVMLQQTPGVLIDRQNVGGSESGQQATYVGKGTDSSQNAWNVDGVSVTDMSATGSSSTYYDFDAFEQMQMTTGGSDPSVGVPGVTINMVTKRGTNEVHGSARFYETPNEFEARPTTVFNGRPSNSVDHIGDYGVEAGGPLWPDRAWLWGSYGRDQINKLAAGYRDDTTIEDFAGKLNLQPIGSNNFTLFFFRGDKLVFGRGASPTRPPETTWDQKGPTTIWKGEDSQVFGTHFVASANWSWEDGGFFLTPEGGAGPNGPDVYNDSQGVWHNSIIDIRTKRPQHQVNANLSAFFDTGSFGHELKFGFGYRKYGVSSMSAWPGQGNVGYLAGGVFSNDIALLTRERILNYEGLYLDAFLGETITAGHLTVNAGVRWDRQKSKNLPSNVPANAAFPDLLPAISYGGSGYDIDFQDWQPRVGLTYKLGTRKATLLRASYARFADQLGSGSATFENPVGYQYLYYYWTDTNHNNRPDPGELGALYGFYGVNPNCTSCLTSPNTISPHLKNTTTDELMAGVDQEILPELVAGLTYTYRYRKNFSWTPYTQLSSANFIEAHGPFTGVDQNANPVGTTGPLYCYSVDGVSCGLPEDFNGGKTLANRPGYSTTYNSVELALTKRLSKRWMAHGSFTWTNWRQSISNRATGCQDPSNAIAYPFLGDSCDNAIAYQGSVGIGGYAYLNARWEFNLSALYQLPWNFNIGANFYGRDGYPAPYYVRKNPGDGLGPRSLVVGTPDDVRNPSLFQLDLRAEKVIPLFQKADLTLSVDVFNALNRKTVLQQRISATPNAAGTGQAGQVYEVQNPRIVRFGGRLSF